MSKDTESSLVTANMETALEGYVEDESNPFEAKPETEETEEHTAEAGAEESSEPEPEPETETPVTPPKKGLDKRLAKLLAERQQLEERVAQLEGNTVSPKGSDILDPADYTDMEAYKAAYAAQKGQRFIQDVAKLKKDHPEVEALVHDDQNRNRLGYKTANDTMIQIIQDSPVGAKIWHQLLQTPEDAMRIARLNPVATAREMGKLELLLDEDDADEPESKTSKKLPAPLKTVKAVSKNKPAESAGMYGFRTY